MFTRDTNNRARSGQSLSGGMPMQNRAVGAAQHTNAEVVSAGHLLRSRPRQLMTPVGGTGGGWNYRGAWVNTSSYNTNDAVLLGSGTSAGLYLCITLANTNSPDSGIGWVQLGSYATWL